MIKFHDKDFEKDIIMNFDDIKRISKIINEHPISWEHIADAIENAGDLIDYLGPDALLFAVHNEITRRGFK